jgi:hypothetical protein
MEEIMRFDTIKVATDVSIHIQEDIAAFEETDGVCVPKQCEPKEKIVLWL